MARIDRRQKLALDQAYQLYRQIIKGEKRADLYQLANCLTTINEILAGNVSDQFKLTKRLWQRNFESLCDLLITSFPVYIVIYDQFGQMQKPFQRISEPAIVEIHAEGLMRKSDIFRLELERLNVLTRTQLEKVWTSRGPRLKPEDFQNIDCGEFCAPKNFLIGDEVLTNESELGKERAYKRWWDLYWQAYCAPSPPERQAVQEEMYILEKVWGNLYY